MIVFNELLKRTEFNNVWKQLIEFYPDMVHLRESYFNIFNLLLCKHSSGNEEEMIIYIDKQDSENDAEHSKEYFVHGKNNSLEWTGYWDLSASKWDDWLGYLIHDKVHEIFNNEQIIALCLYEMTWFGLSEESVRNKSGEPG